MIMYKTFFIFTLLNLMALYFDVYLSSFIVYIYLWIQLDNVAIFDSRQQLCTLLPFLSISPFSSICMYFALFFFVYFVLFLVTCE